MDKYEYNLKLEEITKLADQGYYEDAYLKPIAANTNGIFECLEKGAEYIHWDEKRKK